MMRTSFDLRKITSCITTISNITYGLGRKKLLLLHLGFLSVKFLFPVAIFPLAGTVSLPKRRLSTLPG